MAHHAFAPVVEFPPQLRHAAPPTQAGFYRMFVLGFVALAALGLLLVSTQAVPATDPDARQISQRQD
ncbi:MAG: hypothetical protein ACRDBH_03535 [Bosea sp. (in: a-proteobacteria)]